MLHGAADAKTLRDAGFTYTVRIADLEAQAKADRDKDATFAASNPKTQLPCGSNEYRHLADYDHEMKQLAMRYPDLVKELTLNHPTIEGRAVNGIEITQNLQAADGKPIFLQLGVHHAREWPSSEHAIEFAYDLLNNYGSSARTTDLVNTTRTIVVPIVNPDGFNISREAQHSGLSGIFGVFDYEMKRKNCPISESRRRRTPPARAPTTRPGACAASTRTATTAGSGAAPARARSGPTTPTAATSRSRSPSAEHPRAAVHALDHQPDHQPHVLEPGAAPAGRRRLRRTARGAAVQGARRPDGRHNGYANHPATALRHHGRDRGLDVLDGRLARLHVRDRHERVPPAVQQRRH